MNSFVTNLPYARTLCNLANSSMLERKAYRYGFALRAKMARAHLTNRDPIAEAVQALLKDET